MAFRCFQFVRVAQSSYAFRRRLCSATIPKELKTDKQARFKTENNFYYAEDPDNFGTLTGKLQKRTEIPSDEGDLKEEEFLQNKPLKSQKLTTRQYADLIKQYVKHKRLKEALDVLEVRMLKQDRVKPENYIYNILIGACAEVGYTKKAFRLYNDMKKRALKPTGDTYTNLFEACCNSPWALDGLKNATHLRELMMEKGVEPNITNYNVMIKAFGRCKDLPTAFKLIDEMMLKKIKIRVHTFNHLLHACIADKDNGLRHALIVWRKMLKMREQPNIYSFNLMLKCVKECNLGSKEDIQELLFIIQNTQIDYQKPKQLKIESTKHKSLENDPVFQQNPVLITENSTQKSLNHEKQDEDYNEEGNEIDSKIAVQDNSIFIQILNNSSTKGPERTVPNLLSKQLIMEQVLSFKEIDSLQDKFAVIGGQDDFLKEMEVYNVKPDIKTFTQMIYILNDSREAENKLIATMETLKVKADISFYNMLIKKRCMRSDYEGAFEVKEMIEKEMKSRKRPYKLKQKLQLKPNVMTYGVLAMACKSQEHAEILLCEMKEKQIKVNIEILGTLLRQGTSNSKFGYVIYILSIVKNEKISVNNVFLRHLEDFNNKCANIVKQGDKEKPGCTDVFVKSYRAFQYYYRDWLKEIDVEEALKPEHPWTQFRENYPETLQRQNIEIKEPKKFYKRNCKYVQYRATI